MPDDITVSEVDPSKSVASHLRVAHDETPKQIAIYNDDYNLLHFRIVSCRFAVVNEVTGIFHSEIVSTLHSQPTNSYNILKRIASITDKLDFPWDSGINLTLSGEYSTRSAAYAFLHLLLPTTDLSQKPISLTALVQF